MEEIKIAGAALPAMPWEERPAGCKDVVWRCSIKQTRGSYP